MIQGHHVQREVRNRFLYFRRVEAWSVESWDSESDMNARQQVQLDFDFLLFLARMYSLKHHVLCA